VIGYALSLALIRLSELNNLHIVQANGAIDCVPYCF
jgi:hypothetical protein